MREKGAPQSPVNYATGRLDAASGAMAAYLAYLILPPSLSLFYPHHCRVPRGQADEPVARSHPVSCRFRPYAVHSRVRRARARHPRRVQVSVSGGPVRKTRRKRAPRAPKCVCVCVCGYLCRCICVCIGVYMRACSVESGKSSQSAARCDRLESSSS